jgi:hypothetical protein
MHLIQLYRLSMNYILLINSLFSLFKCDFILKNINFVNYFLKVVFNKYILTKYLLKLKYKNILHNFYTFISVNCLAT